MNPMTAPFHSLEELDHRENDGVSVSLLWDRTTNELVVDVFDRKTGEAFVLSAFVGKALDVFRHPYAYAARRSVLAPSVFTEGRIAA